MLQHYERAKATPTPTDGHGCTRIVTDFLGLSASDVSLAARQIGKELKRGLQEQAFKLSVMIRVHPC
jgi:hypothetical protein